MTANSRHPNWFDILTRKHEGSWYEDNEAQILAVEHEARTVQILMPPYSPPALISVSAASGDFSFLIGKQLDHTDVDGSVIEGGDGIVMIARKDPVHADTYRVFVWHGLFPRTLMCLKNEEHFGVKLETYDSK